MGSPPTTRTAVRAIQAAAALAVVSLLGSELAIRIGRPQVPGLVWPDAEVEVRTTSWGPTWHLGADAMERRRAGCPGGAAAGDRYRVAVVGGALLHGGGLAIDDSPGPALQRALSARAAVPVCVETLAEPRLPFNAQLASLRTALYGETAEAIVWSLAPTDVWPAVSLGPAVHVFGPRGGLAGSPVTGMERFRHSRLVTTAIHRALPRDRPDPAQWEEFLTTALPAMQSAATAVNARLLVLSRPRTDRPFQEQTAASDPAIAFLQARCAAAGVPFLDLAAEMGDTHHDDLRSATEAGPLDADGAETLAELLAPTIQRLLARPSALATGHPRAPAG